MSASHEVSIGELARAANISARTLRHYDAIGLLPPSWTQDSGERMYDLAAQLRLQRILVLRELQLPLDEIARVLAIDVDPLDALRAHRERIVREREQLAAVLTTLNSTINTLESGGDIMTANLYEGFDPAKQEQHEAELVERYGDEVRPAIVESHRRMSTWTDAEKAAIPEVFADLERRLAAELDRGADPSDAAVQAVIAEHYAYICRFWTPDADSYAGLGDLYVDHVDFRARKDAVHPGLAEFERDAMAVYAVTRLT
jgi:DNA-binding transcriptional MerR regulator